MLDLNTRYPGRTGVASADYPDGSYQDESTPGLNNGTPLQEDWANDREGPRQGMLRTVGSEPNGVVDTAVQSQYIEAVLSNALGHTRPRGMGPASVCAGLHLSENMAFPGDFPNKSAALASDPRDMCLAWDYTKDRPYLIVSTSGDLYPVPCWDYSANPTLGTALTTGLTNPEFRKVISDGNHVYVSYQANGTGNTRVAKFALPWTGSALWDIDTSRDSTNNDSMIVANDNFIAMMADGATTDWRLVIIAKSDGAVLLGKGNDSGYYMPDAARITSNGNHIFWPAVFGGNSYLCSANITNPGTSSYTVKSVSAASLLCDVAALNLDTIAAVSEATSAYESVMYVFHISADEWAPVGSFTNPASDVPNDQFHPRLCYDGLSLNVTHAVRGTVGSGKTTVIRPVNATRFAPHTDVGDIYSPLTSLGCTNFSGDDTPLHHMVFDGRDLWIYFRDASVYNLYRIQSPGLRGV